MTRYIRPGYCFSHPFFKPASIHSLRLNLNNMRLVTIIALGVTMTLALFLRYCEGAGLRVALPDDEEDFRPRPLYRDYSLIRSRAARADDAFDDYGHLRFGRSED